jgi:hypothetical protein
MNSILIRTIANALIALFASSMLAVSATAQSDTKAGALPTSAPVRERVGSVLGKDVYRDQLKGSPPKYDEVAVLFMAPALDEFQGKHGAKFEMTDDEVKKAVDWMAAETKTQGGEQWKLWQERERKRRSELPKLIKRLEADLANPRTLPAEESGLRVALRIAKLEQTLPHASEVWMVFRGRKFEQYLYANYGGGRIIHQQFGPEALDARRKLLLELEEKGRFQITDPNLRKLAYDYWERPAHPGGFHTDPRILEFPWTKRP